MGSPSRDGASSPHVSDSSGAVFLPILPGVQTFESRGTPPPGTNGPARDPHRSQVWQDPPQLRSNASQRGEPGLGPLFCPRPSSSCSRWLVQDPSPSPLPIDSDYDRSRSSSWDRPWGVAPFPFFGFVGHERDKSTSPELSIACTNRPRQEASDTTDCHHHPTVVNTRPGDPDREGETNVRGGGSETSCLGILPRRGERDCKDAKKSIETTRICWTPTPEPPPKDWCAGIEIV